MALLQAACGDAAKVIDVGRITDPALTEVSGLVSGRRSTAGGEDPPWWVHNDSGDAARLYAIAGGGEVLATVVLDGVTAGDWEDIASGPGTGRSEPPLLYVGDIGNNQVITGGASSRDTIRVNRIEEPEVPSAPPESTPSSASGSAPAPASGSAPPSSAPASSSAPVTAAARAPEPARKGSSRTTTTQAPPPQPAGPVMHVRADRFVFRYPDGAHDAEAMLVDPIRGDLVVITKDWTQQGRSGVYRVADVAELRDGATATLESVGTLQVPPGTLVTAADVTRDGSIVGVRSYGGVALYRRNPDEPLWSAFESKPCAGPVPNEPQGESLGFAPDGGSYMTTSEGKDPVLHLTTP